MGVLLALDPFGSLDYEVCTVSELCLLVGRYYPTQMVAVLRFRCTLGTGSIWLNVLGNVLNQVGW